VIVLLLAHLVFAQLTFVLALVFALLGKTTRWRLTWLILPAASGLVWTLTIGPSAAAAGFAAGPAQILRYCGSHGLAHDGGAFANAGDWLPGQLPLALIAASAEAAVAGWLDWLHTDEWAVPPFRPGLAAAIRRAVTARALHEGALVTRDGTSIGVEPATGAPVSLRWAEIAGGVLCAGSAGRDITATGFQVARAALRLRKPVIVLDLGGDPVVGSGFAAACASAGAPMRIFGTGEGSYEPFRAADPARRTELTLALLGVVPELGAGPSPGAATAPGDGPSQLEAQLHTAYELMAAVPGDARTPVLDDVVHLLNPVAMRARLGLVPADGPLAGPLAERVARAMDRTRSDPEPVTRAVRQLADVRSSAAGHWVRPEADGRPGIDLSRVVRERSAALFQADSPGLARLICADILALGDELRALGVDGDALVLVCGCEKLPPGMLARMVASGTAAGLSVVATTTSATAAAGLAGSFGALVIHRLAAADAHIGGAAIQQTAIGGGTGAVSAAGILAARTGTRMVPVTVAAGQSQTGGALAGAPGGVRAGDLRAGMLDLVPQPRVPVATLLSLRTAQFVLAVTAPRPRLAELGVREPSRSGRA
jgi:hypothetical protein